VRYILVALLPVAAGVHGLAVPIVRLLFGSDFGAAVPVLKVVIWTLVPYGLSKVLASSLFASNRQVVDLKVNVLSLAANVLLNLALIPRYGSLGCAWATLLSILFFLGCQLFFLRCEIFRLLRDAEIFRPGMAALSVLLWLHLTPGLALPLRVLGGVVAYGTLLLVLQVVQIRELQLVLPERFSSFLPKGRES
jgi:O-antigen/teichoic acid export membrane protein